MRPYSGAVAEMMRSSAASLEDVGHQALAVNLSDLAAMGADELRRAYLSHDVWAPAT
ncbi:MAG: hypothetical protein K1X64_15830 [Myxococcaceae bacterium]|nr:hypothetical protein [Myxococcaceae bacterium]